MHLVRCQKIVQKDKDKNKRMLVKRCILGLIKFSTSRRLSGLLKGRGCLVLGLRNITERFGCIKLDTDEVEGKREEREREVDKDGVTGGTTRRFMTSVRTWSP